MRRNKKADLLAPETNATTVTATPLSLQKFEAVLLQRQRELEQGMSRTVEQGLRSAPEGTLDTADQAVFSYQKEMLFTQGTQHHAQLSQVRAALRRIAEGTFGLCLHCDSTIGSKRLEAVPWTSFCIDCQERMEKGEIEDKTRVA